MLGIARCATNPFCVQMVSGCQSLLFFINVFELAISADHHPTSAMIVQGGYFLSLRDAG